MNDFKIFPLPCGCVVELTALALPIENQFECPWCAAAFDVHSFREWFDGHAPYIFWSAAVRPLLRVGELGVLEVLGACDCGSPIVGQIARDGARFCVRGSDGVEVVRN